MPKAYPDQTPKPFVYYLKERKGIDTKTGLKTSLQSYRVIDGDSVEVYLDMGLGEVKETDIRILGCDTPEKRKTKCGLCKKYHADKWVDLEKEFAHKATARTTELLDGALDIMVVSHHYDKYGGRIDGDIIVKLGPDDPWLSVGDLLIEGHFALPYSGKTKNCFIDAYQSGYYS